MFGVTVPQGLQAHALVQPSIGTSVSSAKSQARPLPVFGSRDFARTQVATRRGKHPSAWTLVFNSHRRDPHEKVAKGIDHRSFRSPRGRGRNRRCSNDAGWHHCPQHNITTQHLRAGCHSAELYTAEHRCAEHNGPEYSGPEHGCAKHCGAEHLD